MALLQRALPKRATDGDERSRRACPCRSEHDIVMARQMVRRLTQELGFSLVDQTKMVTAASELARNTLIYGGGGVMHWQVARRTARESGLRLIFSDQGPGIPKSRAGADRRLDLRQRPGLGLTGARRLVNDFDIESRVGQRHAGHHRALELNSEAARARRAQRRTVIADDSQIGEARRECATHRRDAAGLDANGRGRVAIVATELATNLFRHGGGGRTAAPGRSTPAVAMIELSPSTRARHERRRAMPAGRLFDRRHAGTGLGAVSACRPSSTSTRCRRTAARSVMSRIGRALPGRPGSAPSARRRGRDRVRRQLGTPTARTATA